MNTMKYRGYTARVEFDDRDNIFVGRVLGIQAIIGFHGETVSQLTEDFHNAIDSFLADCAKTGRNPQKPASGKLMLRIPPEVHSAALIASKASGVSLNQWAAEVIEKAAHS
jgi:predicted HicB family RNase H-like nuclease